MRTRQHIKKNIERSTALIVRVTKKIGIAVLKETIADFGQLQEIGGGYAFSDLVDN